MAERGEHRKLDPVPLAELLRQSPGKWVAIKDHRLVDVAETPDRLYQSLRTRGIRGATIIRSPGEEEPLLVGLG